MKDCKECGGSGAYMGADFDGTGAWAVAKPCPCLTDRLVTLEKQLKAATSGLKTAVGFEPFDSVEPRPCSEALVKIAALEEPK